MIPLNSAAQPSRLALTWAPTNMKIPIKTHLWLKPMLMSHASHLICKLFGGSRFLLNRLVYFLSNRSHVSYFLHLQNVEGS